MAGRHVNGKRRYDNTNRAAQADANRAAVLTAGRSMLIEQGYSSTTIAGIARAAGVSVETVYKNFGTKAELVRQILETAVVGDDQPVALVDRPEMQLALRASTGGEILAAFAATSCLILARIGPLVGTLLIAARAGEPELRGIAQQAGQQRLIDLTRVAQAVAATGDLHPSLDTARAADILWSVGSPEVYLQLTADRGWSADEYQVWLTRTLQSSLLTDP